MSTADLRHHTSRLPRITAYRGIALGGLGLVAAAVLTGATFAAWQANGAALLAVLAANGLGWCL